MADVNIFGIPDDVCKKAGIAAKWTNPNRIGIHAYKHVDSQTIDTKSNLAPCEAKVHFLRPEVILFTSPLRKLVNESNGIFLSIQNPQLLHSKDALSKLLQCSKEYRSILIACVESLQDIAEKALPKVKSTVENYLTIFYNIECIWHLTEILYVNELPGDVVLPQLVDWIRFHFPSRELMAIKILSQNTLGADLENLNYWEAVIGCALHGKLNMVCSLLQMHSKADSAAFVTAENLLKTMTVYDLYSGCSINEFTTRWKQWQLGLLSQIDSKIFSVDPNLEMLMKLVSGDETVLWEFSKYTEAWYELLAAKLFYSVPCCKHYELSRYANRIAEKWQASKHTDEVILALMENDLPLVVNKIQFMNDNGWFACHLIDLLCKCGRLNVVDRYQKNLSTQLRESLVLDYGSTLMGHHSLWQCGASYLMHCPENGLARLEVLLQILPMKSEAKINKIIDLANEKNLKHIVASICKIQGLKCIQRKRLGDALTWALRAEDGEFITHIADLFLKNYAENGRLECRDLLENLGSCMLASERLTFLGKYCEFHQMYGIGEFKEAASLLISLLVSDLTPKYFWKILLKDAIPLLEAQEVILSSGDTYELLRCVEVHGGDENFKDSIETFRLAAARNLSRSLILEGCQNEQ